MTTKEKAMIKKWLKTNKPSVRIKHNIKMPHITPSGRLGQGQHIGGEKL